MNNVSRQSSARTSTPGGFRADINAMRAFSVVLVVLFHIRCRGASGGFVGVDVFFVISGFLMTKIILDPLETTTFSFWRFAYARANRIWPALGAMILILLILGAFLLPPSDVLQIAKQAVWALTFSSNDYFLRTAGYDTDGADGNWFIHTWSLSLEWQFYILYPLTLMFAWRLGARIRGSGNLPRNAMAVWMAVVSLFAVSLFFYITNSTVSPNSVFFSLTTRAWEPLAGGIAFLLSRRFAFQGRLGRSVTSKAGFALILFAALWLGYKHVDPAGLGWWSTAPVFGSMLVLWASCANNRIVGNVVVQSIGRWSYSIYLWHWPLVVACSMDALLERRPIVGGVLVAVGSVLLGCLSYSLIERRRKGSGRILVSKPVIIFVLAALAIGGAYATDGLAFRMNNGEQIDAVPASEAEYFPANCSNFQKEIKDVHPCSIEHHSKRRILVIGDSLAEHLYPWFKAHSLVSVDFLTEAECPPVPEFERLQAGFHCLDYARRAWQEALQPRYDTVVMSGAWGLVGLLGPPYCHVDQIGTCDAVNGDIRMQLVLMELKSKIEMLLTAGKTVVVLEGTPGAILNIPQRLDREKYWFGQPRFRISLASVTAGQAWIDPMFASLKAIPGYHLVSLRPELCDHASCKVYDVELKRSIYVDKQHFDPVWMENHGNVFAPFVQLDNPR